MKLNRLFVLVSLACLLVSCVTTQAVRLGEGPMLPAIPWEKVIVYRTADQVPGRYQEIALITAKGDSLWTDEESMYREMRKKAGALGANAIILDAMSEPSSTSQVVTYALFGVGGNRKGKCLAIYVLPEEK